MKGARCHLVVVAIETGGRWSDESMSFISEQASAQQSGCAHSVATVRVFGVEKAMDSHVGRLLLPRVLCVRWSPEGLCWMGLTV